MKVLILSFSSNQVNEDSFIPNKIGLTFSCVEECEKQLKTLKYEYEQGRRVLQASDLYRR